ncbi:hypothetical protein Kpol_376p8 [Vanderwaltozyma polyspora DSM 70294]|uniref:Hsp70 nucleotide exchange factor FES1 n=1 Tax=Vanderwaltozyma polyspora (strain ATCC 22028 / DSM 70294 / BCRC 21397 / CBS 2163 / NBRC 10782 / NRRL Y-8283 / UCD 57-17) TaxID=436907 RepID=A7TRV8_VANPO|nr:uncharacterized protein Kpol_376p8 [Vanderwaltozyma polyspora DSM 70294]EDO14995.1 hypothetical protein Kpol_376p8 [Vanderwaltozyma polyspora DSM 70294]
MEKLLHWSIANAQGDKEAMERAGQPDPKMLAQLFGGGGPDDPTLMKEAMAVAINEEADLENRLVAIDNFEMLIENLDNANNIENMKLWDPILKLLDSEESELRSATLSIIGTAVQNNVNSQENFAKYDGSLKKLIVLVQNSQEPESVRTKALYALSNVIRNHKDIGEKFLAENGLDVIPPVLHDSKSSTKFKMRAISLLNAFLTTMEITESIIKTIREDNVLEASIDCLNTEDDLNIIDRVLNFLSQLITARIQFTESELEKLRTGFKNIEQFKDQLNEDDYLAVKYVL